MSPINVGFVGLSTSGWASFCLAPALLDPKLEGRYQLVAVSTSSPASAKATAAIYSEETGNKVKAYHGSSHRIASDPNVDLVAVSVKAPLHKELALPAIEAGKDLFVEWPAGASLQETIEIAEAAKRKGVKTIVNLNARNSLVVKKVKELIESDAIGKVRSSTFIGTTYRESGLWAPWTSPTYKFALDKDNGATFLDIAVGHFIYAQSTVLGDFTSVTSTSSQQFPTATVMATEENFVPHEFFPRHQTSLTPETVPNTSPDHYTISGPLSNGAHATIIFLSGANYGIGRRLMQWFIYGEKGVLRLQSVHPFMQIANPDIFVDYTNVTVEGAPGTDYKTPYAHTVSIQVGTWEAFSNGSGYATIDDAVKVKRTLQAIERSAKEGRTVFLD